MHPVNRGEVAAVPPLHPPLVTNITEIFYVKARTNLSEPRN